jgi:hypothetical protein
VNHGASTFSHLLGFLAFVILISLTTPALMASYIKYFSTAIALYSFDRQVSSTIAFSFSTNSGLLLYYFQLAALCP